MNIKFKVAAVSIALTLGASTLFFSGDDEDGSVKVPEGYLMTPYEHLVPDVQVKMMVKGTKPLMYSMMNDRKGVLPEYAIGFNYLLSSLSVREGVVNKRPIIEYRNSDGEFVKLQPKGIHVGLKYSGKSNLNRQVYDEVAFGFISKWVGTKTPEKIISATFGDLVNTDIGLPLSILYFQRQFIEQTELKGFSTEYGYQPLFADYNYLYDNHIATGKPFEEKALEKIKQKISSNIIAMTRYLDEVMKKGDDRLDEKAVFLLEFYLNEDMKMLKSLERDVRMITPPDNADKEELRIKRLEQELRRKQIEASEREKANRKSRRLSSAIMN